jgi:hypothetical protein
MVPQARALHEYGASAPSQNSEIERQKVDDMLYFCRKWLNGELYRELAVEGSTLDAKRVHDLYQELLGLQSKLTAPGAERSGA